MALREMNRRVDVGAAVLGREQAVRSVVIPSRRDAFRILAKPEAFRSRPVDRLRVVGVREIDELPLGNGVVVGRPQAAVTNNSDKAIVQVLIRAILCEDFRAPSERRLATSRGARVHRGHRTPCERKDSLARLLPHAET